MLSLGVAFVVPKASPLKASFLMFKENTGGAKNPKKCLNIEKFSISFNTRFLDALTVLPCCCTFWPLGTTSCSLYKSSGSLVRFGLVTVITAHCYYLPEVDGWQSLKPTARVIIKPLRNLKILQRDFHMAVAWWMDTGIYAKMLSDVLLQINSRREFERVEKFRGSDKPLSAAHLLASFLFLGAGLTLSVIALACELLAHRGRVKNRAARQQR